MESSSPSAARIEMIFSKHLLESAPADWDRLARRVARAGLGAVDLTVRPKGHVEPERVYEDLPRAAEALRARGIAIGMITTGIVAADAAARKVLACAAKLGIRYYKLGYHMYAGFGTLRAQRLEACARFRELAALNRELGIHGGYHNHSDDYFGANLYDVAEALEGSDPRHLGCYLDPCHAVIEGSSQGWLMGLDAVAERVSMLAVKDFRWVDGKHRYAGGRRNSIEFCPLAEGNTPWPQVLAVLRRIGFSGPVSFHAEYQGSASFRDLDCDGVAAQAADDLAVYRGWSTHAASGVPT
jgi:L-ribulose-5-phosphate 3-epimerase